MRNRDLFPHHDTTPFRKPKFIIRENKMKTINPTNNLFAMTRYRDAYTKRRITRRWNHGPSEFCTNGWVPNTFLVGSDTAGMNGRNEMTKLKREYPDYFETIRKDALKKRYGITRYLGNANYEFNRIRTGKREDWYDDNNVLREGWNTIVEKAEADWIAKHGELRW